VEYRMGFRNRRAKNYDKQGDRMSMLFDRQTGMQRLATSNEAHLYALSQQGNESLSHAALMEQATAQSAMQNIANEQNLEVPKVNFYPSRHPDPHKARKKDIRQARKLLTPAKRAWFNPMRWLFGQKYRYDRQASMCVVDGCDCGELLFNTIICMQKLLMKIQVTHYGNYIGKIPSQCKRKPL
jgi:dipeptidyl aminopeptidase/acylaminoacyl peptidase